MGKSCFNWLSNKVALKNRKLNVTDLNISCLEIIFNNLELQDLLNIADSNEHLKKAAGLVFVRKYGSKKVWFHKPRLSSNPKMCVYSSNILIEDLKSSLQILRCFGPLIKKLEISENRISTDWEFTETFGIYQIIHNSIMSYVNQFCVNSLKEIALVMIPKGALDQIMKPFKALEIVHLFSCYLSHNLMPLDELFPDIRCLKLEFNEVADPKIIEEHWPRLKHLEVNIDRNNIQNENVEEILCLNPQLRSVKIGSGWDIGFLQCACKFLHFIESLEIENHFSGFLDFDENVTIHFSSVKRLKISMLDLKSTRIPRIPLAFDQLEELTLDTNLEISEEFYEFVRQNPNIIKLAVPASSSEMDKNSPIEFRNELVPMKEIDLGNYNFTAKAALEFLHKCKSLKKFSFKIDNYDEFVELSTHLGCAWQASVDENRFVQLEHTSIENFLNNIHDFLDNLQLHQN